MARRDLERHVWALVDEAGAYVLEQDTLDTDACLAMTELDGEVRAMIVLRQRPTRPLAYLLALHELGHLAHQKTRSGYAWRPRLPALG